MQKYYSTKRFTDTFGPFQFTDTVCYNLLEIGVRSCIVVGFDIIIDLLFRNGQ